MVPNRVFHIFKDWFHFSQILLYNDSLSSVLKSGRSILHEAVEVFVNKMYSICSLNIEYKKILYLTSVPLSYQCHTILSDAQ